MTTDAARIAHYQGRIAFLQRIPRAVNPYRVFLPVGWQGARFDAPGPPTQTRAHAAWDSGWLYEAHEHTRRVKRVEYNRSRAGARGLPAKD